MVEKINCGLTKVHKIVDILKNIEMKIEEEDKTLPWLISSPRSFKSFKDALFYGKDCTIILDEVQEDARSKEFSMMKELHINDNGKCSSV